MLNTDEPLSDLELSKLLAEITQEAIDYLKNPQNREALVTVSRGLEQSDPVKYKEFQAILITHDAEFKTIFENLSYPLSNKETTIVAALPNQPIVGNMSKGFSAKFDADTSVNVLQDGEIIRRSLSL